MSFRAGSGGHHHKSTGYASIPPAPTLPARPPAPANHYPRTYNSHAGFTNAAQLEVPQAPPHAQQAVLTGYSAYHPSAPNGLDPQVSGAAYAAFPDTAFGGSEAAQAAAIAQWNASYVQPSKAHPANGASHSAAKPIGPALGYADADRSPTSTVKPNEELTVVRKGGLQKWEDKTLLEWDPAHPRLFVGNLAGEVTDDSLFKAFNKYPSLVKARVVRDKRTTKSKGFGFVSFSSSEDYFNAFKDMSGKYIGSHPITLKKATSKVDRVNTAQASKMLGTVKKKRKDEPVRPEELELQPDLTMDDVIAQYDDYQKRKTTTPFANSPAADTSAYYTPESTNDVDGGHRDGDHTSRTKSKIAGRADTGAKVQKASKKKAAKPKIQLLG